MKKIISIILTVVMLSAVVMTVPFSAFAATSPVKSYDSAKPGELLYTVDFRGNDGAITLGRTNADTAQMDYEVSADGSSVRIYPKSGAIDRQANLWGGLIEDLEATNQTIYSMVYKAKANGTIGKNNSVGVGGWAVSEAAFQTSSGVYNVYSNHNTKDANGPSEDQRTALSNGITKIGQSESAQGYVYTKDMSAIDVDADGYVTALVVYDGTTGIFANYYLAEGKTDLKDENSWIKFDERWMYNALNGTDKNYMCFWTYAFYNVVDTTIKDVQYYKEFLWSKSSTPSNPTYDEAADGDLLYTFNFNGDARFTPARLDQNAEQMEYTAIDDGAGVIITNKAGADGSVANLWGGVVTDLPATKETTYSMVYQIKGNDEIVNNDAFRIGAWVVGDNGINDTDKVYSNYVYEKDTEYYVDGDGFMTVMVVYNAHPELVAYGDTPQFSSYILAADEADWIHVETQNMDDSDTNGYMCFWTYASNDKIEVTIKNASIYKGNLVGTYSVEDLEKMTNILEEAVENEDDLYVLYEKTAVLEYIVAELDETDPDAVTAIAAANDVIDAAVVKIGEILEDDQDEISAGIQKFDQALQSGKIDLKNDIIEFNAVYEKVVYYAAIDDFFELGIMDEVLQEVTSVFVQAYIVINENLDSTTDALLGAMSVGNATIANTKIGEVELAIAAGEEFGSIVEDTSFLSEAYAVLYAAKAYLSAVKAVQEEKNNILPQITTVQKNLNAAKAELEQAIEALKAKDAALVAKDTALEKVIADLKAALEAKVAALEAKVAALETKNATLEAKNATLEEKDADLEANNATLKANDGTLAANDNILAKAYGNLQIMIIVIGAAVAVSILANIALAIVLIVSKKKKQDKI